MVNPPEGFRVMDQAELIPGTAPKATEPPPGFRRMSPEEQLQPPTDEQLALPEFGTIDGNNALFGSQFGDDNTGTWKIIRDAGSSLMTLNPRARVDIIEKSFPELQVQRIGDGDNAVITNPRTGGQAVVNAGGLSNQDIMPIVGQIAAFTPVAKLGAGAKTLAGVFGRTAATEAAVDFGLQTGEILQGSEQGYDPTRTAIAAGAGGTIGAVGKGITNKLAQRRMERQLFDSPEPHGAVAEWINRGDGAMSYFDEGARAMRHGMDPAAVDTVKKATTKDRQMMNTMLDIVEKIKYQGGAKYVVRPSNLVGRAVKDRLKTVDTIRKNAGNRLEEITKQLSRMSTNKVDYSPAVKSFKQGLKDMGITLEEAPSNMRLSFTGSDIEGFPELQELVTRTVKRMTSPVRSPYDVHRLKMFLYNNLDFDNKVKGMAGKTEILFKNLAKNLNDTLRDSFPQYKEVNDVYAASAEALKAFDKAAGSINWRNDFSTNQLGILMRRIGSNSVNAPAVSSAVKNAEAVASDPAFKRYGSKAFDNNVLNLQAFSDEIDSFFTDLVISPNSLKGQNRQAVDASIDTATGNFMALARRTAHKIGDAIFSTSFDDQVKVLRELIDASEKAAQATRRAKKP